MSGWRDDMVWRVANWIIKTFASEEYQRRLHMVIHLGKERWADMVADVTREAEAEKFQSPQRAAGHHLSLVKSTSILLAVSREDADDFLQNHSALHPVRVMSPGSFRGMDGMVVSTAYATSAAVSHPDYEKAHEILYRSKKKTPPLPVPIV